uniref:Uncharacterized protein n=1 Tax=Glossina morsitans morsitans TaxID=37546 RepID=A0A1B0GDJ6_GLOMM
MKQFEKTENSTLNLQGKSKGNVVRWSFINPDWDFAKCESEANIRWLFAESEEEKKRLGPNNRGSVAGNSGVYDIVVDQLLAKIDGAIE